MHSNSMNYLKLFTILLVLFFSVRGVMSPVYAANASLSLSPASQSITSGTTFDVAIVINTDGADTSGTDVYINFDRSKLVLLEIVNGTVYDQYVGKDINNATGRARLSGLASSNTSLYTGTGTFATLRFQAYSPGTATVTFDFTPGNLNDTNIADFNSTGDSLASVTNGNYTITGTAVAPATTTTSTSTTTTTGTTSQITQTVQPATGGLPVTASPAPTVGLGILGILIVWLSTLWSRIFG